VGGGTNRKLEAQVESGSVPWFGNRKTMWPRGLARDRREKKIVVVVIGDKEEGKTAREGWIRAASAVLALSMCLLFPPEVGRAGWLYGLRSTLFQTTRGGRWGMGGEGEEKTRFLFLMSDLFSFFSPPNFPDHFLFFYFNSHPGFFSLSTFLLQSHRPCEEEGMSTGSRQGEGCFPGVVGVCVRVWSSSMQGRSLDGHRQKKRGRGSRERIKRR
jgi:hypothetical protein